MKHLKKITKRLDKNKNLNLYYTKTTISDVIENNYDSHKHEPIYITGDRLELTKVETCDIFLDTKYEFTVFNQDNNGKYIPDNKKHLYITVDDESGEIKGWLSVWID